MCSREAHQRTTWRKSVAKGLLQSRSFSENISNMGVNLVFRPVDWFSFWRCVHPGPSGRQASCGATLQWSARAWRRSAWRTSPMRLGCERRMAVNLPPPVLVLFCFEGETSVLFFGVGFFNGTPVPHLDIFFFVTWEASRFWENH